MESLKSIYIGFDPREAAAFAVANSSAKRRLNIPVPIHGLVLSQLRKHGYYTRKTVMRGNVMWDVISDAPMSTEHANSRFLIPCLEKSGLVLFMDGDVLVLDNLASITAGLEPDKAVYCVKHCYEPNTDELKMDDQIQTKYARKNWSSVMLFRCDHPKNRSLTPEFINGVPGRDLHRFCWLEDDEIGELNPKWNWLVGQSPKIDAPSLVHFTLGYPDMAGYEDVPYSDEWREELERWASLNGGLWRRADSHRVGERRVAAG